MLKLFVKKFDLLKTVFKFKKSESSKEDLLIPVLSKEEKELIKKNEFTKNFLSKDVFGFSTIEENLAHLNSLSEDDVKYSRLIAISENEKEKVVLSVGVINHLEEDQFGVLTPVLFDILSGKLVRNIKNLSCFNLEGSEMIAKLNKGQFLSLFKMAHICIDEEMEIEPELNKNILNIEDIEKLKKIGFCSDEEKTEEMNFIRNYWNHSCLFKYNTSLKSGEIEKENLSATELNEKTTNDMIKNKRLVLPLTNENDEPKLSVIFGLNNFGLSNQFLPRIHELSSEKENTFFGLPHYFSKTLLSCFKKLTKQDINALYYGIRKDDIDKKDKIMYTDYENFEKNINSALEKYKNYSEKTVEKHF